MSSGQYTETETETAIASLVTTIQKLTVRIEILEGVSRAMDMEQRAIRRDSMYHENLVFNIWRRVMGPTPDTPDEPTPVPTPLPPLPPLPLPPLPPRPRPPVPPRPEPIPTPAPPPKPPSGPVNKVSDAINSFRGRFGW